MPQRSHTRRRGSARPGGSSLGRPQRLQNRIGLGRSVPVAVHDLSIRMRAVTVAIRTRKRARRPSRTECARVQSLRLHEPWPVLGGRDTAAMRAAVAPTSTRRLAGAAVWATCWGRASRTRRSSRRRRSTARWPPAGPSTRIRPSGWSPPPPARWRLFSTASSRCKLVAMLRSADGSIAPWRAIGLVGIGLLAVPGATGSFFSWQLEPEALAAFAGGVYVGSAVAYAAAVIRPEPDVRTPRGRCGRAVPFGVGREPRPP